MYFYVESGTPTRYMGAHWRHLANTIEPSICGGNAVLCRITLTTLTRAQQKLRWATVATIDMGLKEAVLCPFRGALETRLIYTMWPAPRSTSIPSGVFIYPAVWPQ